MCRMKTMFKSFALIAIAALSLAACSKNEAPINDENEMITLKFNIKNADDAITRALLGTDTQGNRFLNWENGDQIGSFAEGTFGSNTTSNNNAGTVDVSGDDFTLNIQTFSAGSVTKIYSYFPFSSAAGKEKTAAVVSIPTTQYITTDGFDADAMPMAGTPISVDLATAANTNTPCGTITFSNLGSIINFKIYSSEDTDETLTSVKYVASSGKLGGSYTIDLTAIDATDESTLVLGGNGSEAEITTIHQGNPTIGTGKSNAIDVYMVVAPGTYSGTQVVVTTSTKTYTLNASGEKTYVRSHVKPMYVDIKKGAEGDLPQEETWVKVTSASDFTAGTYYILNWDEKKYLPNVEAGSAPSAKDFMGTVTDDMKWEASVSNGGLIFKNPESELYLWGRDDNNNGVRVKKDAPSETSAKIWKFTPNTAFGVVASVGSTRYLATYNNNGTHQDWRNYQITSIGDGTNTNSQGNVVASVNNFPAVFYKLQAGDVPQKETPELAFNNPTTTVNVEETVTNIATINPSTLEVTYSSSDEDVATVTSAGVVTGVAAGTATITAAFAGNEEYNAVSASYDIIVIDPNANDGSEAKPYTASEAVTVVKSGRTQADAYVQGIISKITTAYISSYGNVSFDISDDGLTTSDQFRIFRAEASSANDFKVGDAVTFKGNIIYYNNQTPEMEQGNELISQLHAPVMSPANGAAESVTITADQGATIRYTTDGSNPTAESGTVYSTAITISATTTIKAIAVKDGVVTGVVSGEFTVPVAGEYILDGTKTGGTSGYAEASDISQSGISWKVEGNTTMSPWRIGGKSLDGVERTIYSVNPIQFNVESIEISHGTASDITVNSMTVIVASDASFTTVVSTLTPTFVASDVVTVNRPADANWSNCYYKIIYNVSVAGSSNKFIQFMEAKFTGN